VSQQTVHQKTAEAIVTYALKPIPYKMTAGHFKPLEENVIAILQKAYTDHEKLVTALKKINDIRNSIIGYQNVNWSAHIYPLVAALNEAGFKGDSYEVAMAEARTQLDLIASLEDKLERAKEGLREVARNGLNPTTGPTYNAMCTLKEICS